MSDSTPPPAILRRVQEGVAWITLNRPDAGNAIDFAMRDQLITWLEDTSDDLGVRAVVITGAGDKGFCTGADLRSPVVRPPRPEGAPDRVVGESARMIRVGWQRLIAAVLDCEKPVIAAVNATAAGGGLALALACDLVLAAEDARFIAVFVRRGIVPDAGAVYLLTRLIGPQRAKELCFFGDDVSARDAERLGLVNRVVGADQLPALAAEWAARLASGPTPAIGLTKYLANRVLESDRSTAFWEESVAQELVLGSTDSREGLDAFAQRRPPQFKGW
ncbi:MAG TPA: enoyl-CoA hydratase-related protein [Acidimicrobiales bacterium]|jgi:2-(1,2-epoxy-1,2-dihydrophenyl)acetyl-CoA isomerase|nr:enoyl-CoA hydratase-related protein [Acidimicrobiales bacterium]